ncbi:MAG: 50S ribosomal protein L20 [Elusimicrobia bacterium]|jgi:large subunit ribosomal protein L20|nr:50S ribosomal protein L20 [Elusimicrobiota bacterium]
MRVKRGTTKKRKHKKILKEAKGYAHAKSKRYRNAKNQVEKSWQYSTRDRKNKKREMRRLWITRINAACTKEGISYSKFIHGLKKEGIAVNRKVLQQIAVKDSDSFARIAAISKKAV